MKTIFKLSLLLAFLIPLGANAQCKGYAKRQCRPNLAPYIHDGKMNFAQLFPGDKAEVELTFYARQSYRLLVCGDDVLGNVQFKVYDTDKNVLFDSEKSDKNYLDFKTASTQKLIIEVIVPEGEGNNHGMEFMGCVAIMTGLKN